MKKKTLLAVGVGGILGSSSRYLMGLLLVKAGHGGFPLGTLVINYLGCIMLGMFSAWIAEKQYPEWFCRAVDTGFIGSFTTFSTFSAESMQLLSSGHVFTAFVYIALSVAGGLLLSYTGHAGMQKIMGTEG